MLSHGPMSIAGELGQRINDIAGLQGAIRFAAWHITLAVRAETCVPCNQPPTLI